MESNGALLRGFKDALCHEQCIATTPFLEMMELSRELRPLLAKLPGLVPEARGEPEDGEETTSRGDDASVGFQIARLEVNDRSDGTEQDEEG